MFEHFDGADGEGPAATTDLAGLVSVLVAAAGRALAAAAQLAADELDDATLTDVVLGVERLRRAVDATEAHALAELHDRGTTDRTTGLATSQLAGAARPHSPPGSLANGSRVANRLSSDLGAVDDALSAGHIGVDHARAVADARQRAQRRRAVPPDLPDHARPRARHGLRRLAGRPHRARRAARPRRPVRPQRRARPQPTPALPHHRR